MLKRYDEREQTLAEAGTLNKKMQGIAMVLLLLSLANLKAATY